MAKMKLIAEGQASINQPIGFGARLAPVFFPFLGFGVGSAILAQLVLMLRTAVAPPATHYFIHSSLATTVPLPTRHH